MTLWVPCKGSCDLRFYNDMLVEENAFEAVYVVPLYYGGMSTFGGPYYQNAQRAAGRVGASGTW
jgi:hypothetical protein